MDVGHRVGERVTHFVTQTYSQSRVNTGFYWVLFLGDTLAFGGLFVINYAGFRPFLLQPK